MVQLVLYQPDIAANVGAVLRLAACLALPVTVIEPCGFVWAPQKLRRVALDYARLDQVDRQPSWAAFEAGRRAAGRRLVLLSTKAAASHLAVAYRADDLLLAGRESAGVPAEVAAAADLAVRVPLAAGRRSLNVVSALTLVLAEALRQTEGFPDAAPAKTPSVAAGDDL